MNMTKLVLNVNGIAVASDDFREEVTHLPHMLNCFGEWIALREIHQQTHEQLYHGRVRGEDIERRTRH